MKYFFSLLIFFLFFCETVNAWCRSANDYSIKFINDTSKLVKASSVYKKQKFNADLLKYPTVEKAYKDKILPFDIDDMIQNESESYFQSDEGFSLFEEARNGSVLEIPKGTYYANSFSMNGKHDLTLKAEPGTVWFISNEPTMPIFMITNCSNITFDGIGFLHQGYGECDAEAVYVENCKNVVFNKCDISGSGTIGINASNVDEMVVQNCYLHHCTMKIMNISYARNIIIRNNLFKNHIENLELGGIWIGDIWGKCILQNNTFCNNKSAAITLNIRENKDTGFPRGDGHVFVYRNFFYNNYSPEFNVSISENENFLGAVTFKDNIFNTADVLPIDNENNERIYAEKIDGKFELNNNYFEEISHSKFDYSYLVNNKLVGIYPETINWLEKSRLPYYAGGETLLDELVEYKSEALLFPNIQYIVFDQYGSEDVYIDVKEITKVDVLQKSSRTFTTYGSNGEESIAYLVNVVLNSDTLLLFGKGVYEFTEEKYEGIKLTGGVINLVGIRDFSSCEIINDPDCAFPTFFVIKTGEDAYHILCYDITNFNREYCLYTLSDTSGAMFITDVKAEGNNLIVKFHFDGQDGGSESTETYNLDWIWEH